MMTKHFFFMTLLTLHATDACENANWNGDGFCDDSNNKEECGWDDGDCCGKDVDTTICYFCQCLEPEYSSQAPDLFGCLDLWIGDGSCDDRNNNVECGWDGADCCGRNVNTNFCSECECLNFDINNKWDYCNECECLDPNDDGNSHSATKSLHACGSPDWVDDNYCDDENNNQECGWDGGDCCSNFDDICSSKCNKDEKCCQIKDFEHWHNNDHGPSGSDVGLSAYGFGPSTSGYGPSGYGNGPPRNIFGYHDVYCKPFVDEITGCQLFCDPVCEDSQVQCSTGCGKPDYCNSNENSIMDSHCQSSLYDTPIDDYDNFTKICKENGGASFGNDKICIPHQNTYNIKLSPKPPENDLSMTLSRIQITEIGDKLGQIMLIMDLDVRWKDNRIQLVKEKVPIFLSNEDQNHIWSPRFRIGTDLISNHKQGDDEVVLMKEYLKNQSHVTAYRKTYLSTTFICEMDFQNFPFDKQNCTLEVSIFQILVFQLTDCHVNAYLSFLLKIVQKNETTIESMKLISAKKSRNINNYKIDHFIVQQHLVFAFFFNVTLMEFVVF